MKKAALLLLGIASLGHAKSIGTAVKHEVSSQSCVLEAKLPGTLDYVPFCSATLVGRDTLITAAHCKQDGLKASGGGTPLFQARCGVLATDSKTGEATGFAETLPFQASGMIANPAYSVSGPSKSGDIGYVLLDKSSMISPAEVVLPGSSLMAEIESKKENFMCRSEGFGLDSRTLDSKVDFYEALGSGASQDTLAERGEKMQYVMDRPPVIPTSYAFQLDKQDLVAHQKGINLRFNNPNVIDWNKFRTETPAQYNRVDNLFKGLNRALDLMPNDITTNEKKALVQEFANTGFAGLLNEFSKMNKLYAQSLWGDSGGGQICQDRQTGKTYLISVTSRIGLQNSDEPEVQAQGAKSEFRFPELKDAKGTENFNFGTEFSTVSFLPSDVRSRIKIAEHMGQLSIQSSGVNAGK